MEENINQEVQTEQEAPVEQGKPKAEGEGEKKKYKPIKCICCGNKDLKYVAEYHKCIWLRILVKILQVLFFISLFFTVLNILPTIMSGATVDAATVMQLFFNGPSIWLGIVYAVLSLVISIVEAETHVKCICPKCGTTWNHID